VELQKLRHCIWESQSCGICGEAMESGFVFGNRKAGFVEDFAEGLLPVAEGEGVERGQVPLLTSQKSPLLR
jgi:hypothetical protein